VALGGFGDLGEKGGDALADGAAKVVVALLVEREGAGLFGEGERRVLQRQDRHAVEAAVRKGELEAGAVLGVEIGVGDVAGRLAQHEALGFVAEVGAHHVGDHVPGREDERLGEAGVLGEWGGERPGGERGRDPEELPGAASFGIGPEEIAGHGAQPCVRGIERAALANGRGADEGEAVGG
jgi:hypothetical protein